MFGRKYGLTPHTRWSQDTSQLRCSLGTAEDMLGWLSSSFSPFTLLPRM